MKAFLKNYRQSPRKVRLVADLVRNKKVDEAMVELDFLAKRASFPIKKILMSAVANAKQEGIEVQNLFIKDLRIDKGVTMKRIMPAAMGSAHRINKRTSNIMLILAEKLATAEKKVVKEAKKVTKKVTKKALPKTKKSEK